MTVHYGFSFIQENCVQCHACEVACKSWRDVGPGIRWRRVAHLWQGRYPRVKNTSASIACMHCIAPACVEACPEGAIEKRTEDGIVIIDTEKCTGCRTCLEVCPVDAPQFGADGKMQKCDMCADGIDYSTETPPCVKTCPTHALLFGKMSKKEKAGIEEALQRLLI